MAARAYGILCFDVETAEFVQPGRHEHQILMLSKVRGKAKLMVKARHWVANEDTDKAQVIPIPVQCPMCGDEAEVWQVSGYLVVRTFVVCDGECNVAIRLQGCGG